MFKKERFFKAYFLFVKESEKKSINGFLLAEALLALLVCMISGCLLIGALSALSKTMELSVQPTMEKTDD